MSILKILSFIPDEWMIRLQYWIKLGRQCNLKNPKRYTEKLQWYKVYYKNPLMTQCVDKYAVREYIKSKGLEDCLTELIDCCSSVEEVDFATLPDKFVIKTTNGSGTNLFCLDKSQLNKSEVKMKLREYMDRPQISAGREWAYYDVVNRIVIEELLENDNPEVQGIDDYKFACFGGKVFCIIVDTGRFTNHRRNFYDKEWKRITVVSDHDNFEPDMNRPEKLEEMIRIAEILSSDFPAVRVDLYYVNGKIYFGEMTFYPWSGYVQFEPDEFDYLMGDQFELPKY